MAESGVDIDLYADVENDFPAEDFNTSAQESETGDGGQPKIEDKNDLYDDVLTNVKEDPEKPATTSSATSLNAVGSIPHVRK